MNGTALAGRSKQRPCRLLSGRFVEGGGRTTAGDGFGLPGVDVAWGPDGLTVCAQEGTSQEGALDCCAFRGRDEALRSGLFRGWLAQACPPSVRHSSNEQPTTVVVAAKHTNTSDTTDPPLLTYRSTPPAIQAGHSTMLRRCAALLLAAAAATAPGACAFLAPLPPSSFSSSCSSRRWTAPLSMKQQQGPEPPRQPLGQVAGAVGRLALTSFLGSVGLGGIGLEAAGAAGAGWSYDKQEQAVQKQAVQKQVRGWVGGWTHALNRMIPTVLAAGCPNAAHRHDAKPKQAQTQTPLTHHVHHPPGEPHHPGGAGGQGGAEGAAGRGEGPGQRHRQGLFCLSRCGLC